MADSQFTMDLPESPHIRVVTDLVDGEPAACQVFIGGRLHFDGVTKAERDAARAEVAALRKRVRSLADSIHGDEGWEHNGGCEGEPECFACIVADLRAALDGTP